VTTKNQQITQATYEDPEVVEGYIQRYALEPKQAGLLQSFVKTIKGTKILDLGCGPGHNTYLMAELGFEAIGIDYSREMINRAKKFKQVDNQPTFLVGDIRKLTDYFPENTFDAIWASASLIHIKPINIPLTLSEITNVAKNGAKIYISLKGGQNTTILVDEDKYGKKMQREFTLWTKDAFIQQTEKYNLILDKLQTREGSLFMGQPTAWLDFFFTIEK